MTERPGRVLGIDLGVRRIGAALSDSARTIASPHKIIECSGDRRRDRITIANLVKETGASLVVVGLPIGLDGRQGAAARDALAEAAAIEALLDVPVCTCDERFTTVEAERRLLEAAAEIGAARRGGRGARRESEHGASRRRARALVDDAAAAIMLQSWLDGAERVVAVDRDDLDDVVQPGTGG